MNKFLLTTVAVALASSGPLARAKDDIDAEALLREVRRRTAQNEELTMKGQLREGRKKHPFRTTIRRTQIAFLFENKMPHTLVLDLGAEQFRLRESHAGGPFVDVPSSKYHTPIRKTGVNYLDISLAYLYWPNPKYLKEDVVSERITWVLEVQKVKRGKESFWALEKMLIYTLDPRSGRIRSRTYMELDK